MHGLFKKLALFFIFILYLPPLEGLFCFYLIDSISPPLDVRLTLLLVSMHHSASRIF